MNTGSIAINPYTILSLVAEKRHGKAHTQADIDTLITAVMAGEVPDYQLSAWLMAVCCNGMSDDEAAWLTNAYVHSGKTLSWKGISGVVTDKHSTGGVGDKTTLVLAPMMAACGLKVAKLSGRGLGFTGGTIDKLEAIPGFQTALSLSQMQQQVADIGIALSCQTPDLAPADGKLYTLRDVTATVDSIPLIAASVVSKKIASGAAVIVLDVKYGHGAFMKTQQEAQALANLCETIGTRLGHPLKALTSSMEAPLGRAVGHTVEVIEALETLKGKGPSDLVALCVTLGAEALVLAKMAPSQTRAAERMRQCLEDGSALEVFCQWVTAQGGNFKVTEDYTLMPQAKQKLILAAPQAGCIESINALRVAEAAKMLGAGRTSKDSPIDLGVGIILQQSEGTSIQAGDPLAEIWLATDNLPPEIQSTLLSAFTIL